MTHSLQSPIRVNGKIRGHLQVFYPPEKPFLVPEEQRLIDAVASDLEMWLERKEIDEALRERLKEIPVFMRSAAAWGRSCRSTGRASRFSNTCCPRCSFRNLRAA